MKYLLTFILFISVVFAQTPDKKVAGNTLYAGTSMIGRTAATTLDDTTRVVYLNGWNRVFAFVYIAANDSANILVQYQGSYDGVTFGAFSTIDSLVTTGVMGASKSFEVPSNAMGLEAVRFRVAGQAWGGYSANPSTTVSTIIRYKR